MVRGDTDIGEEDGGVVGKGSCSIGVIDRWYSTPNQKPTNGSTMNSIVARILEKEVVMSMYFTIQILRYLCNNANVKNAMTEF